LARRKLDQQQQAIASIATDRVGPTHRACAYLIKACPCSCRVIELLGKYASGISTLAQMLCVIGMVTA